MRREGLVEGFYDLVTGDEDARVCKDIPDSACNDQPENFTRQLISSVASKIGDELASPRLVLAWLLTTLAAPSWTLATLVPLRESGALLPQLVVAAAIRRVAVRKWFWVAGSVIQGMCAAGMGLAGLFLTGTAAGVAIVALLAVFSLARGVCSVAAKDVLGKTVSKTRRGVLTGYATAAAGVVTLAVGLWLASAGSKPDTVAGIAALLIAAAVSWGLAAFVFSGLAEQPGATEGGGDALTEAVKSLRVLVEDAGFRRFVETRALLLGSALLFPYYAALAQRQSDGSLTGLGFLLIASGLASSLSAGWWGKLADRSSRRTMARAGWIAGVTSVVLAGLAAADSTWLGQSWVMAGFFFAIGVAHAGVRVGRKTYLVDMATAENRATLVAVSNTVIGGLLLASSSVGLLGIWIGEVGVILVLAVACLLGAWRARSLREVTGEAA